MLKVETAHRWNSTAWNFTPVRSRVRRRAADVRFREATFRGNEEARGQWQSLDRSSIVELLGRLGEENEQTVVQAARSCMRRWPNPV